MKKETPKKKLSLNVETLKELDLNKILGDGTPLPAFDSGRTC